MTWNTSFQPLLAYKVSFEKSADSLMETPLQVTVSFSLGAYKILSLFLILGNVIMMCLGVFLLGSNFFGTLSFLDLLEVYFLPTIYATQSLYLSPLSPPPTPLLITLHVISISVVLFLFQLFAQFAFVLVLGVVVNNCVCCHFTVHNFYLFLR